MPTIALCALLPLLLPILRLLPRPSSSPPLLARAASRGPCGARSEGFCLAPGCGLRHGRGSVCGSRALPPRPPGLLEPSLVSEALAAWWPSTSARLLRCAEASSEASFCARPALLADTPRDAGQLETSPLLARSPRRLGRRPVCRPP